MKEIKELAEHIEDELEDAKAYIETALAYKDKDRDLADMYAELSKSELSHAGTQHAQVVRLIRTVRDAPPPEMMAVWEYLHKRHIKNEEEVRRLQAMFRE